MNQYKIIKLRRLIHCMTKQSHDYTDDSNGGDSSSISCTKKKIALEQINLAHKMLNEVRELFISGPKQAVDDNHNDQHHHHRSHQYDLRKRDEQMILQKLEISVEEACLSLREKYYIGTNNNSSSSHINHERNNDLVHGIFFKEDDDEEIEWSSDESDDGNNNHKLSNDDYHLSFSDDEEDHDEDDDNDEHDNRQNHRQQNALSESTQEKKKLTIEELQKQQEEQLQSEISEMAAQLKNATKSINQKLTSGNDDLDNLASLAQSNFDKVKNANEEVTKHVKASGWRKSVGRWVVFFCILSTWIFCFLTIRVIPKRKGACLFFCEKESTNRSKSSRNKSDKEMPKSNDHNYYSEYYEDDDDDYDSAYESSSSSTKSSQKKVTPKYSHCKRNNDNGHECTVPDNFERYTHKVPQDDAHSQYLAHDAAAKIKAKRYLKNLKKAEGEEDIIGSNRVREGWYKNDDNNVDDKLNKNRENEKLMYTYKDAVNAAYYDSPLLVSILLEDPDLVDYADENGWTLLHEACRHGNMESVVIILRYLDENDVNIQTKAGNNAMWLAKHHEHDTIVQILAENGGVEMSLIGKKDNDDDDHYNDDQYNDQDETTVEHPNGKEDEIEKQSKSFYTYADAVYVAQEKEASLLSTILRQNPEFLEIADKNGWTLLHEAVRGGKVDNVSTILDFVGNVSYLNTKTNAGQTAMWLAKSLKYSSIYELLEARGGVELPSGDSRNSEL